MHCSGDGRWIPTTWGHSYDKKNYVRFWKNISVRVVVGNSDYHSVHTELKEKSAKYTMGINEATLSIIGGILLDMLPNALTLLENQLLRNWRFLPPHSACIHWLVHGHMYNITRLESLTFYTEHTGTLPIERLRMTFTANGKREIWPRDHVYPIFVACCLQLSCQIE